MKAACTRCTPACGAPQAGGSLEGTRWPCMAWSGMLAVSLQLSSPCLQAVQTQPLQLAQIGCAEGHESHGWGLAFLICLLVYGAGGDPQAA